MWLTGIKGLSHNKDSAFAKFIPVQRAGSNPGPCVTEIASILGILCVLTNSNNGSAISISLSNILCILFVVCLEIGNCELEIKFAFLSVVFKIGSKFLVCSLFARAGNTPPYSLWMFI